MRAFYQSFIFVFIISFFSFSCQRSPQYRKDEDFVRSDRVQDDYELRNTKPAPPKVDTLGQPKKSVVILDFWNDTPVKQEDLGSFIAEELKRGLALTQRVILPDDVKTEMRTDDFLDGDRVKVAQLVREGRRLGVSVVVIGRIKKITIRHTGDNVGLFRQKQSLVAVDLEMKAFDAQNGREIMASSKSGETSNSSILGFDGDQSEESIRHELTKTASREALAGFLPEILKSVEKMTWQGRIAKIMGPKIYVNAGRASGLIQGDILKVLTPGDDIYDPASGAYLGRSKGQLKGTLEIMDFIGTDGAVSQIHTGGNFKEGDLVQLY